jgi:hypothetical protein
MKGIEERSRDVELLMWKGKQAWRGVYKPRFPSAIQDIALLRSKQHNIPDPPTNGHFLSFKAPQHFLHLRQTSTDTSQPPSRSPFLAFKFSCDLTMNDKGTSASMTSGFETLSVASDAAATSDRSTKARPTDRSTEADTAVPLPSTKPLAQWKMTESGWMELETSDGLHSTWSCSGRWDSRGIRDVNTVLTVSVSTSSLSLEQLRATATETVEALLREMAPELWKDDFKMFERDNGIVVYISRC